MSPPNRPPSIATPSESESTDRSSTGSRLTRRTFVAAGSTTALVSLAGCSAVVDFLGDLALQDVNVFNGAEQSVSGSIEVVDPDDETVLEETFDLEEESDDDDDEQDDEATAQYDDVWTDAGDYEVTVTLDEPIDGAGSEDDENQNESNENETDADLEADSSDVDSDAAEDAENETAENETAENETDSDDSPVGPSRTDTVTVDDTEEQNLVIGIAQDGPAELISYHVIEDISDLEDEFEE